MVHFVLRKRFRRYKAIMLMVVWFRENVLICTKCVYRGVLFRENVLDGTKNSFARKWCGIQPLIKISSPEMSPFAENFVITDIYIYLQS